MAEKYAVDYTWYVDTILNLIRIAGDYVSEEVWYRVIQIVINRDDVQGYAAKTVFEVQCLPFLLSVTSCLFCSYVSEVVAPLSELFLCQYKFSFLG